MACYKETFDEFVPLDRRAAGRSRDRVIGERKSMTSMKTGVSETLR